MSQLLTPRQAEELHKSIVAYLTANNLASSANALRQELNLSEEAFDATTAKKYEGLIEKKWTSVVRLQKKIMDLESRNATLQSELDNATPSSLSRRNQDPTAWLPKLPARHTLESHREAINCVAFHPVFSSLASGSEDLTIKIWDWEIGELERTIKGHTRPVLDLDFGGPRGNVLLASCSSDMTIKLWDPSDGYKNIRTLPGHDHTVTSVRFVSSNVLLSGSRDKTIRMWDTATGYCTKTINAMDWIRDVSPSIDGRYLISGGRDWMGRVWDISATTPETKLVLTGHEHEIECCVFAPPASYKYLAPMAGLKRPPPATSTAEFMATGGRDKKIRLWNAQGQCFKSISGHDNWVRAVAFHPGGRYLVSVSDDKSLRCWDLQQDGKCVKKLEGAHEHFVSCMRWAPPIIKEVVSSPPTNGDATNGGGVNGTPKKAPAEPEMQIRCVIATGSVDKTVKIFAS